ncbi:DUF2844 domain-containing protein [Chromobacterium alticapitis]|uniref:DUF2844 domain-containing protein n=1 Tax=Chromobacterium alticapitis TaxID=2073169 RepID=A0A2S5DEQ8_9NEIS|nr:DUF2844 domain-containing protein [Chromobacterium alticapitis]POZ61590.1 hypothetical protein C2I19_13025 [Chromobacterium alticapitis]
MKPSLCISLSLVLLAPACFAALGQRLETTGKVQRALALKPATQSAFSVQASVDEAGRQIRQYLAVDGTVFAVAWSGRSQPDLPQLLGDYFPAFRQAQRNNRSGLNVMRGQVGTFAIHTYGRMGALQGMACDLALLPAGVTLDQLK